MGTLFVNGEKVGEGPDRAHAGGHVLGRRDRRRRHRPRHAGRRSDRIRSTSRSSPGTSPKVTVEVRAPAAAAPRRRPLLRRTCAGGGRSPSNGVKTSARRNRLFTPTRAPGAAARGAAALPRGQRLLVCLLCGHPALQVGHPEHHRRAFPAARAGRWQGADPRQVRAARRGGGRRHAGPVTDRCCNGSCAARYCSWSCWSCSLSSKRSSWVSCTVTRSGRRSSALGDRSLPEVLASCLLMLLVLVPLVTVTEVSRALGPGALRRLLLGPSPQ